MANIKKLLQSKEGGEGDESSLVSRLRRQLMKSLDSNRKLVAEIAELHSENEAASTKLTKLRNGMRKGFLHHKEEVEKRKAEKEKKKIETSNQTTQVEVAELSKSYTASVATEGDTGEVRAHTLLLVVPHNLILTRRFAPRLIAADEIHNGERPRRIIQDGWLTDWP